MQYYPLFLDISAKKCLVVGAGQVGRRKIASLQNVNAKEIIVIDKYLDYNEFSQLFFDEYAKDPEVIYLQKDFCIKDLQNISLVFAATSQNELNGIIADNCKEKNIFCNVIEDSFRGDFIVPATLQCSSLTLALSTSGLSPALARALKNDLATWLDLEYAPFLKLLEQVRVIVLEKIENSSERRNIFRTLVQTELRGELFGLLNNNDQAQFIKIVQSNLPKIIFEKLNWDMIFK